MKKMAKTTLITLSAMAEWKNICWALHQACRGKSKRTDVQAILNSSESAINKVGEAFNQARLPVGSFHSFTIYDPKKRLIHAAPILDRVAHHAIVRLLEPTFERVLVDSVFACRKGKGVHAAIHYAQQQSRRFRWILHVDIKHYFPHINHSILANQLQHRFRGDGLQLLDAVLASYQADTDVGLPIGALTSQHFANHYLNLADRWSLAQPGIQAHCRYMDDFLFWSNDKAELNQFKHHLTEFLDCYLALNSKPALLQRTDIGLLFCGVHIKPFKLKPSQRRRRRYASSVVKWEQHYRSGEIDGFQLQRAYDSAKTILLPADDLVFRKRFSDNRKLLDA